MYSVCFYLVHSACIFQYNPYTPVPRLWFPDYGLLGVQRCKPSKLFPSILSKGEKRTGHVLHVGLGDREVSREGHLGGLAGGASDS